jgi:hypothetical protein
MYISFVVMIHRSPTLNSAVYQHSKSGGSAKRFSIEDEGCASEARSRRVAFPERVAAIKTSQLVIDPLICYLGVVGGSKQRRECYARTEEGRGQVAAREKEMMWSRADLSKDCHVLCSVSVPTLVLRFGSERPSIFTAIDRLGHTELHVVRQHTCMHGLQ